MSKWIQEKALEKSLTAREGQKTRWVRQHWHALFFARVRQKKRKSGFWRRVFLLRMPSNWQASCARDATKRLEGGNWSRERSSSRETIMHWRKNGRCVAKTQRRIIEIHMFYCHCCLFDIFSSVYTYALLVLLKSIFAVSVWKKWCDFSTVHHQTANRTSTSISLVVLFSNPPTDTGWEIGLVNTRSWINEFVTGIGDGG